VSFRPEVESDARPGEVAFGFVEASSSRYADPEAEGVTPVFKTAIVRQILVSELLSTYTSFGGHLVLSFLLAYSDHGGSW
jgi:hypothetical protein